MHHDAKVLWERVKVGTGHPDAERVLKDFVVSYNSEHVYLVLTEQSQVQ